MSSGGRFSRPTSVEVAEDGDAGSLGTSDITQNNSNVSAPVTIQVHSSGANAEQIGQKLYDTAERYLLRTLKSAMT